MQASVVVCVIIPFSVRMAQPRCIFYMSMLLFDRWNDDDVKTDVKFYVVNPVVQLVMLISLLIFTYATDSIGHIFGMEWSQ